MTESQLLAVALAYAKSEVDKSTLAIQSRIQNELDLLETEKAILARDILKQAIDLIPIKELPPGIVFESHLEDAEKRLRSELTKERNRSLTEQEQQTDAVLSKISEYYSEFSAHDHHDNYSHISHTHTDLADKEHEHSQYALTTDLVFNNEQLTSKILDTNTNILEKLEFQNSNLKTLIDQAIFGVDAKVSAQLDILAHSQQALKESLESAIKKSNDKTASALDEINSNVASNNRDVALAFSGLTNTISKKADRHHEHIEYASFSHVHHDLATKQDTLENSKQIKQLKAVDAHLAEVIEQLRSAISKKLSADEALTKKDIDEAASKITRDVIDSIPAPVPGKDAEEWEFRVNPKDPSIFQFKKATDKKWTSVIPSHVTQPAASFGGYGGGGADVSNSSSVQYEFNGNLVEVDDTDPNNVKVTIDSKTSDVNLRTEEFSLTGKTPTITSAVHNFVTIANCEVVNISTRKPAFVDIAVSVSGDIIVDSLVNLDDYALVLVGV